MVFLDEEHGESLANIFQIDLQNLKYVMFIRNIFQKNV